MKLIFIILSLINLKVFAADWYTEEFKKENITDVAVKLYDSTSLQLWLAGTASSLYAQNYDTEGRDNWKNHQQMSRSVANFGDLMGTGIGSALVIAGQYYWDKNENNWKSHARGIVWEAVAVTVLKYSFGKQRPGNRNNYVSFPSGHTSTAFASATSLTYSYGWKAGIIAFPLATVVGLSRMADDMHWVSDVVAGAFLGVIMGRAAFNETHSEKTVSYSFVPKIYNSQIGFDFYKSF